MLLATFVLKLGDKKAVASQISEVCIHTVFDPYKALASLPAPLVATEALQLATSPGPQSVKVSAGLHRQIWVSGNSIFVDIHIVNKSDRCLKKLEVELQRSLLWYDHAAAGTGRENADHLRIHKRQDCATVNTAVIKRSKSWHGILPHSSEVRTCQIDVPRGQVTVSTGRFFEVRYFLNLIVTVALFKTVSVQLPVTLIHMNSLDIMPNALAQVASSIEAKRSKTLPLDVTRPLYLPYHQGQAFIAPQKRSLEQTRGDNESIPTSDLEKLKNEPDQLPHRYQHSCPCHKSHISDPTVPPGQLSRGCHDQHESGCHHYHLVHENPARPSTSHSRAGGNLPRLRVSTSGLGFTDTEFSVQESPPKKVMLSEQERRMINQQRELEKRREWKQSEQRTSNADEGFQRRCAALKESSNRNATNRLHEQIKRAEPHLLEKNVSTKKRTTTLEHPRAQARKSVHLRTELQPRMKLGLSDGSANLSVPNDARKRTNTEPENVSKPLANEGVNAVYKGVTSPQGAIRFQRMSGKRRGKLPADDFVLSEEKTKGIEDTMTARTLLR